MPRKYRSSDTFTTADGRTMTRKQLQNLVSKANYKVEHARSHLSPKEYKQLRKNYAARVAALGIYVEGQEKLSIKGVVSEKKLRAIEATARGALGSAYVQKKKYKQIDTKRFEEFKRKKYIENEDQYKLLKDLFTSKAWNKARDKGVIDSKQLLQQIQDEIMARSATANTGSMNKLAEIIAAYTDLEYPTEKSSSKKRKIKKGTWEDVEKKKKDADAFVPSVTREEWADMDEEERATQIIDDLLDAMR